MRHLLLFIPDDFLTSSFFAVFAGRGGSRKKLEDEKLAESRERRTASERVRAQGSPGALGLARRVAGPSCRRKARRTGHKERELRGGVTSVEKQPS